MRCPFCGDIDSKVVDSRPTEEGSSIRRRRECLKCAKRFTTYETIESLPLLVIKKDGTRQTFNRSKLLNSLVRACDKRSVTLGQLEELVTDIEQQLLNSLDREVPSSRLGDLVMERLREIDEVSYVRFASVYRQFTDVSTFLDEVNKLLHARKETL
ncbi:MAG: transcriptional regulator NrdR [Oscillospiraceae bacterium]|jgi:transcriptional repressor NrdR|nr:transcriptional regulator NrdR [Oscillospiraceae bacterium]